MPPRKRTVKAKPKAAKPKPRVAKAPFPLPEGWRLLRGGKRIALELKTKDFLEALVLINEVGQLAESLEHHPDFHLERWNRLRIETYSHDVGKLTERDQRLAEGISDLVAKRGLHPA